MDSKLKWAILVTGWGKNAFDTLEAFEKKLFKNSQCELFIYENEPCGSADKAKEMGISTIQIFKSNFENLLTYQKQLIEVIKSHKIDYVFMLNYKYVIKTEMLNAFPNRILNIHPSLFPSFLATKTAIQDALSYGVKVTGVTTHIIDDKLDEGVILAQKAIEVEDDDTFESLYPKFAFHGAELIKKTIKIIEKKHFQK